MTTPDFPRIVHDLLRDVSASPDGGFEKFVQALAAAYNEGVDQAARVASLDLANPAVEAALAEMLRVHVCPRCGGSGTTAKATARLAEPATERMRDSRIVPGLCVEMREVRCPRCEGRGAMPRRS